MTISSNRLLWCGLSLSLVAETLVGASDWPQWRGPHRDGVSSEAGLLQQWPEKGPALLWKITGIGSGYSTPAVVGPNIYLLGNEGLENEFVQALKVHDGSRIWSTRLGQVGNPKQNPNFPAARSTPTVAEDVLFALGSDGDLACVQTQDGKVRWHRNLRSDFGGKSGTWAYSESPLLDGDHVICTPGGSEATVVALDRQSGEVVWKCALPEADEAAYASAILVNTAGVRQIVQLLQKGLVGIEASSGKLLWRFEKATSKYNANIPTPLFADDLIYCASAGTGGGAIRLLRKDGGIVPEEVYFGAKMPTAIGGVIQVKGHLYGTTATSMLCADLPTGEIRWDERGIGAASLCYADGRLYLHGENGEAALVQATPEGYHEKGRFSPPDQPEKSNQMEKSWAYPVVADGRLYLRDHDRLWCYDVKARP